MDAVELENLIIRLTGDGSSYQQMMTTAQKTAVQTGQVIGKVAQDIDGFGNHLSRFAEASVAGLGIFGAERFLRQAFGMYQETEMALLKLTAAVKANGGAVDETLKSYKTFAKDLKDLTGASVDDTYGLLKQAEAFGVTGEAAERSVRNALALAAGGDASAQATIRITTALEKGDIKSAMLFKRAVAPLRQMRDETAFMAKYQQLLNIGQEQQTAIMNSGEGAMRRFNGTVKAITKQFGQLVDEAVTPFVKEATKLLKVFTGLEEDTKRFVVLLAFLTAGFLMIGPATAAVSATVVPLLRMMADGFQVVAYLAGLILRPLAVLEGIGIALGAVFSTVFSFWGLALIAATAGLTAFILRMGGLKPALDQLAKWAAAAWKEVREVAVVAWDYVKAKTLAFIEWLRPIGQALGELFDEVWEAVKEGAVSLWTSVKEAFNNARDWIGNLWSQVRGDAEVDWEGIRAVIVGVIGWIRYGVQNLGAIAQSTWRFIADATSPVVDAAQRLNQQFVELGFVAGQALGPIEEWATTANMAMVILGATVLGVAGYWIASAAAPWVWAAAVAAANTVAAVATWAYSLALTVLGSLSFLVTGGLLALSVASWVLNASWVVGKLVAVGLFAALSFLMAAAGALTAALGMGAATQTILNVAQFIGIGAAKGQAAASLLLKAVYWLVNIAVGVYTGTMTAAAVATTIATAGVNFLIASLAALALVALPLVIAAIAAISLTPIIAVGYLIHKILELTGVYNRLRVVAIDVNTAIASDFMLASATISRGVRSIVVGFGEMSNRIVSAFGFAWDQTAQGFSEMLRGMLTDGQTAWVGIVSAFKAGDYDLVWAIVKTTAQIAWERIKTFGLTTWEAWKSAGLRIFYSVWDFLQDTGTTAWTTVKKAAQEGLATMEEAWWRMYAKILPIFERIRTWITRILGAVALVPGPIGSTISAALAGLNVLDSLDVGQGGTSEQPESPAVRAALARADSARAGMERITAEIDRQAAVQQEAMMAARRVRDADLQAAAQAAIDRARVTGQGNIEALQRELQKLKDDAMWEEALTVPVTVQAPDMDKEKKKWESAGQGLGQSLTHGVEKETKKLDSVLRFSADALERINEYRDMLAKPVGASAATVNASMPAALPSGPGPAPAVPAPNIPNVPPPPAVPAIPNIPAPNVQAPNVNLTNVQNQMNALMAQMQVMFQGGQLNLRVNLNTVPAWEQVLELSQPIRIPLSFDAEEAFANLGNTLASMEASVPVTFQGALGNVNLRLFVSPDQLDYVQAVIARAIGAINLRLLLAPDQVEAMAAAVNRIGTINLDPRLNVPAFEASLRELTSRYQFIYIHAVLAGEAQFVQQLGRITSQAQSVLVTVTANLQWTPQAEAIRASLTSLNGTVATAQVDLQWTPGANQLLTRLLNLGQGVPPIPVPAAVGEAVEAAGTGSAREFAPARSLAPPAPELPFLARPGVLQSDFFHTNAQAAGTAAVNVPNVPPLSSLTAPPDVEGILNRLLGDVRPQLDQSARITELTAAMERTAVAVEGYRPTTLAGVSPQANPVPVRVIVDEPSAVPGTSDLKPLLTDIRDLLRTMTGQPSINLATANLQE